MSTYVYNKSIDHILISITNWKPKKKWFKNQIFKIFFTSKSFFDAVIHMALWGNPYDIIRLFMNLSTGTHWAHPRIIYVYYTWDSPTSHVYYTWDGCIFTPPQRGFGNTVMRIIYVYYTWANPRIFYVYLPT